ncbi:MAG: M61 family metallopeptidase, partial [Bacteroidia bacterium]
MKKFYLLAVALLFAVASFAQQDDKQKPIFYSVSFPNAAHHEAEIVITIPQAPSGKLLLRMSRSSAGRYATHEFGKNIYNVKASNVDGTSLTVNQVEGDVYEIP